MVIKYQFSSFTIKELFGGCINYVYRNVKICGYLNVNGVTYF